jgi:hypothetical protein
VVRDGSVLCDIFQRRGYVAKALHGNAGSYLLLTFNDVDSLVPMTYQRGTRRKRTDWGGYFECALLTVGITLIVLAIAI